MEAEAGQTSSFRFIRVPPPSVSVASVAINYSNSRCGGPHDGSGLIIVRSASSQAHGVDVGGVVTSNSTVVHILLILFE